MRRKGPGVGGIKKAEGVQTKLQERGAALQEDRVKHMTEVIEQFRIHLEDFARKYKTQIRSDPVYRAQFQTMCEKVGVDPLASSKGIWGELLGLGDYYYELGARSPQRATSFDVDRMLRFARSVRARTCKSLPL